MAFFHRHDILHRDLKPANVLITENGVPKITDFGLAKKLDEAGQTQSGAIMGTPSYMAPEQAKGQTKEIGPAADVYSLGAMLYELLTGRPPFKCTTIAETLELVKNNEPVAVRVLQPKCPKDLETICLKCLAKDPDRRYPSAEALEEDLRRYTVGEPISARPPSTVERAFKWIRRKPLQAWLLGLVLMSITGLVLFAIVLADKAKIEKSRVKAIAKQIAAENRIAQAKLKKAELIQRQAFQKRRASLLSAITQVSRIEELLLRDKEFFVNLIKKINSWKDRKEKAVAETLYVLKNYLKNKTDVNLVEMRADRQRLEKLLKTLATEESTPE